MIQPCTKNNPTTAQKTTGLDMPGGRFHAAILRHPVLRQAFCALPYKVLQDAWWMDDMAVQPFIEEPGQP